MAASIEVGASVNNPRGRVEVVNSRLQSTMTATAPSINIWASYGSFGGSDGVASITAASLLPPIQSGSGCWTGFGSPSRSVTA